MRQKSLHVEWLKLRLHFDRYSRIESGVICDHVFRLSGVSLPNKTHKVQHSMYFDLKFRHSDKNKKYLLSRSVQEIERKRSVYIQNVLCDATCVVRSRLIWKCVHYIRREQVDLKCFLFSHACRSGRWLASAIASCQCVAHILLAYACMHIILYLFFPHVCIAEKFKVYARQATTNHIVQLVKVNLCIVDTTGH